MSAIKEYECLVANKLLELIDKGHTGSSTVQVYTLLDDLISFIELDNKERKFKSLLRETIEEALTGRGL